MDRRTWFRVSGALAAGLSLTDWARHEGLAGGSGGLSLFRSGPEGSDAENELDPWAGIAPPAIGRAPDPFEARMEELLDVLAARREIFSAVLGAATGDSAVRWIGARGEAVPGGAAMTPDTPFFTASITKLYIAAAVMRMVEEGELALGDRMVDRLPSSFTRGLHVEGGVDRTDQITIEHLLGHTSGLPDFIEDIPPRRGGPDDRRSLVEILLADGDRDWSLTDTTRRVREALRPHFPPQSLDARRVRIRYSDTNYQLLMGIVEHRRDSSFPDVLEESVLEPLGLRRTWVSGHPREGMESDPVATVRAGEDVVSFPRFFSSIGDLDGTAEDLLRFLRGMIQGALFRSPDTWPRMQARWNRFPPPLDRAALRQPSWPIEYGLGVMRYQLPRLLAPLRPPPAVLGHSGSTGTWLFYAPELDLYLVGAVSQIAAAPLPFRFVPRVLRAAQDTLGR
jgi:D-alanyl-D-alanine carboxypeptidase